MLFISACPNAWNWEIILFVFHGDLMKIFETFFFFFWLANLKIRVQEKWEALEYLYFKTGGLGEINDSV